MDNFAERERAIENKFQHEQFIEYKILARRNRLFGLWVASYLGLESDQAEVYAREVVSGAYCTPNGHEVVEKVIEDLSSAGADLSEHVIKKQLDYCYQDASVQIFNE